MKNWLKEHFIPSERNMFRPQFLHKKNMLQIAGVVVLFELVFFLLPTLYFAHYFSDLNLGAVLPGVLATLTNTEREKQNLPDLVENPTLNQIAQMKANDMAAKGYFAHTSPEGKTPWYWFQQAGYKYAFAGENLAVNFTDSEEVTKAWMNSPTHRANIVAGTYREVGTGIATGVYEGKQTVFVAQVYGTPVPTTHIVAPTNSAGATPLKSQAKPVIKPKPLVAKVTPAEIKPTPPVTLAQEEVLGEATPVNPSPTNELQPNFLQKILQSPRQATSAALYIILAIVLIALFLNIVIKAEEQHPDLILHGAVVAAIIIAIHLGNTYISRHNFQTSFIAFDSTNTPISTQE